MSLVKFNPQGGQIKCDFLLEGAIVAEYSATLYEANSNAIVVRNLGHNGNPDGDVMFLPSPIASNNERMLYLNISFMGKEKLGKYKFSITTYQDGQLIGEDIDEGEITGGRQTSLLVQKFVKQ